MKNLKKYLDAVNEASARVTEIAAQIDTLFDAGKIDEATAKRPELDAAKVEYDKANQLYLSMLNANSGGDDPAQRLIPAGGNVQVVTDEGDQPFESDGAFFRAVKNAALYPARADARLRGRQVVDATGASEGVPADGGYLLPQQTASGILERMYTDGAILSRIAVDPVAGNSMTYNGVDETSRADGSRWGGVRGYWTAEGASISTSKPAFRQFELKLKKVAALCYATDELLEDVPALESWLNRTVPAELRFLVEDAVYNGDGVGKPLGVMNSPCLVSVLRVDASKVQVADIVGMYARRWAGVSDYVWFINQDVEPQLLNLNNTYQMLYLPPGGLSASPYGTLLGKPVVPVEYAATLGTTGDIMLANMSQYQAISKGGIKSAQSIHVAFATDEMAFRFLYRIDGQPTWHAALTPYKGSNTQSPFVVLTSASA